MALKRPASVIDLTAEPPAKRPRVEDKEDKDAAPDRLYYWIEDAHSYSGNFLRAAYGKDEKPCTMTMTPTGRTLKFPTLTYLYISKLGQRPDMFIHDKSRSAGDRACSISLDTFDTCQPYLLNLTGRSYARQSITELIAATLAEGLPMNLEDGRIEPEQLQNIRLYANNSLGPIASDAPTVIDYSDAPRVFRPFNPNVALQSIPALWEAAIPGGNARNEDPRWHFHDAAARFLPPTHTSASTIVAKDLLCEDAFPLPAHAKVPPGKVVFRNCLFRRCTVLLGCWCGVQFVGCRFEDCTFELMYMNMHYQDTMKQCEFQGGRLVVSPNFKDGTLKEARVWLSETGGGADYLYPADA